MIIREPKPEDSEAIIKLLQLSLGESKLKKTQEIWNFKHEDNPFGKSPVFLAEEDNSLIGVRAFMKWNWQLVNTVWTSYRAVDTATHPKHQGKGIFKTLTLRALEYVQKKDDCFIFNTPNEKSRPGYLKMGWKQVNKINVALIPTLFYMYHFFSKNKNTANSVATTQLENLCKLHNNYFINKSTLFTPKSAQYLKWRYEVNPLQDYHVISNQNFYIALYIKKHRFFNELRVVETIGSFDKRSHYDMRKVISKFAIKNLCLFISIADKNLFSLKFYGGYGPILTFKSLTNSESFDNIALNIENWSYSLGDLELF